MSEVQCICTSEVILGRKVEITSCEKTLDNYNLAIQRYPSYVKIRGEWRTAKRLFYLPPANLSLAPIHPL